MPINKLGQHFLNKPQSYHCILPLFGTSVLAVYSKNYDLLSINYGKSTYVFPLKSAVIEDVQVSNSNVRIKINQTIFMVEDLIGKQLSKDDQIWLLRPNQPSSNFDKPYFVQFVLLVKDE